MSVPEFNITLPVCAKRPAPTNSIVTSGPLVIVGANGSGKSRIAAWLEAKRPELCHRVSAQKTLTFPVDFRGESLDAANKTFLYGTTNLNARHKFGQRYSNAHDAPLNDFQKLVTLLFSEAAQVQQEYVQKMRTTTSHELPPLSRLDVIKGIWEQVLPSRELIVGAHQIHAQKRGESVRYAPKEMSDGERVIFYLIGQCLCAPKNGVILLDEPELHLHRALQTRLWDAVESERRDCLFVYITHDLEFAASRQGGTHVWLSEYSGGENWEWDIVPTDEPLPDALLLEVLGSRKPVLFVEGKATGDDDRIYRAIYPTCHVIAMGSCGDVIHATASCKNLKQKGLVNADASGLIDRDGRTASDIESLQRNGVKVMEWAEIENLLVHEDLLKEVSKALHRDPEADVTKVKRSVMENFSRDADRIAAELAGRELDRMVRGWGWKHQDGDALQSSFTAHFSGISPEEVFERNRTLVKKIIDDEDYAKALRVYPNKGLIRFAGGALGLKDYDEYILRRVTAPDGASLLEALRKLTPALGG